jgi:hypothetical protein
MCYEIKPGDVAQVEELLKGFAYIFPLTPDVCSHLYPSFYYRHEYFSHIQGNPDRARPYRHPAIIQVISDLWFKPKGSVVATKSKYFKSNDQDHPDELEITQGMVAFAATTVSF